MVEPIACRVGTQSTGRGLDSWSGRDSGQVVRALVAKLVFLSPNSII